MLYCFIGLMLKHNHHHRFGNVVNKHISQESEHCGDIYSVRHGRGRGGRQGTNIGDRRNRRINVDNKYISQGAGRLVGTGE